MEDAELRKKKKKKKKKAHAFKVGFATVLGTLIYYLRQLYEVSGRTNAIWGVITIIVVFENSSGATFYKCLNRISATFLAAAIGVGVQFVASQAGKFEPIITLVAVFIVASATTYLRFMPMVKDWFDYGASIFILTFSLITVLGYRINEVYFLALQRLGTVAFGTCLSMVINRFFYPIWVGDDINELISKNLERLAYSLDAFVAGFFETMGNSNSEEKEGYRRIFDSDMARLIKSAKWEPPHGRFKFRHPWDQYLNIDASIRDCACCLEALCGCITSEIQTSNFLKGSLSEVCITLSSSSCNVFGELSEMIKANRKSFKVHVSVGEMKFAIKELRRCLNSLPNHFIPPSTLLPQPQTQVQLEPQTQPEPQTEEYEDELEGQQTEAYQEDKKGSQTEAVAEEIEVVAQETTTAPQLVELLPIATFVSLLIDFSARIERIVNEVDKLARLAGFNEVEDVANV